MGKEKDHQMKNTKIAVFLLSIGLICSASTTCMAGGMNANEASVYAAASGTFEYEGKSYTAASEYLSQLSSYLCRDDIDLTADQANAAIAEMNANIAKGVAEGYILPVGGTDSDNTESADSNVNDTEQKEDTGNKQDSFNKDGSNSDAESRKDNSNKKDDTKTGKDDKKENGQTITVPANTDEARESLIHILNQQSDTSSDEKKELKRLAEDLKQEGSHAKVNINLTKNEDAEYNWNALIEEKIKGKMTVLSETDGIIMQADYPVKNTGYVIGKVRLLFLLLFLICVIPVPFLCKKKKFSGVSVLLVSLAGMSAMAAFGSGLIRKTYGIWNDMWLSGAPQYDYETCSAEKQPVTGDEYGEISCEKVDLRVPLYWGDNDEVLTKGAGTYMGSSLPGKGGVILAGGHDATTFASLQNVTKGDMVTVKTASGQYIYQVTKTEVMDASEYKTPDSDKEQLVLYTCYPFGEEDTMRSDRYFVYAEKTEEQETKEEVRK